MSESLRSALLSTSPLGVALVIAVGLTLSRCYVSEDAAIRDRAVRVFLLGVAAQCLHFTEEYLTGLHVEGPRLLGLAPLTPEFFVAFNAGWIALWILAAVGLRARIRIALVPAWFFAIGMVLNVVIHPLLTLQAGGYFPGLVTSPVAGVVAVFLWPRLLALTRPGGGASGV